MLGHFSGSHLTNPGLAAARHSQNKFCSALTLHNHCIFLSFKHLHSPLCACSQDRNLLRDSSKTVSSDAKPSAIKLV